MKKMIYIKALFVVVSLIVLSLLVKAEDNGTVSTTTKDTIIAKPGEMVVVPDSQNRTFLGIATRNACKPSTTACRLKN